MKRSDRIATVARVREVQEQLAEQEAIARRREADEQQLRTERSIEDVRTRQGVGMGSALSFTELAHRRRSLEAAAVAAEHHQERRDQAVEELERARASWHRAHGRHDAADRLLDRALDAEADAAERTERAEVDDLIAMRHGRTTNTKEST